MFDAQTINLRADGTPTPSTSFYSPWFPRGGDYGIFTVEVAKFSDSSSSNLKLSVDLAQKNSATPGSGTDMTLTGFEVAGNATGASLRDSKDVTDGFLELVRYKFTLSCSGTPTTGTQFWATFRMLAPVWYDKV